MTVSVYASLTFSTGSFVSALSAIAGAELLDRASAIEATSMNLGIVIGPALAGVLTSVTGAARVVELQAALTLAVALVIAVSPSFEARAQAPSGTVREVMREGTLALARDSLLRDLSAAGLLASLSWGLMLVSFPLYARTSLHAGASAGGYLWAAIALGSILGTFLLPGEASRARIGRSCLAVGLSGLLWPLAGSLWAGVALIGLTGFVEGPFYAGTIALRQRLAPAGARTQMLNTLSSLNAVALAAGSAVGGVVGDPSTTFLVFAALNVAGAAVAGRRALLSARPERVVK